MKKSIALKELIRNRKILVMPGAQDALTARIIEQAGFQAVVLGGYASSASLLGRPDIGLLTLTEMATIVRNVTDAVDIPVLADGDTGHGGIPNVIRSVREFERAGAAGLLLEDQIFPKRCGHMEGKQVIEPQEMVSKLRAAVDTRNDPDLVITARTDARAVHGLEDAVSRANLYAEAGADLIFVEAPLSEEELRSINEKINAPTLVNVVEGGKTPQFTASELEDMGFAVVAFPLSSVFTTAWAIRSLMEEMKQTGSTLGCIERMVTFDNFNRLMDLERHKAIEARYNRNRSA